MLKPLANTQIVKDDSLNCMIADGIYYYDIWGVNGNPPKIYEYLLSSAQNTVWIWDPYINPNDCVLFQSIKKEVNVRCLTFWGVNKTGENPLKKQQFLDDVKKVQQNNKFGLEIKFYNIYKDSSINKPFHDRYLFVDDNVYSVGSSIGYHHGRGSSSTAIHLIDKPSAAKLIENRFLDCWKKPNTEVAIKLIGGFI